MYFHVCSKRVNFPIQLSILSDWVCPDYLNIGTLSRVQSQFEVDSQIRLPDFLLVQLYSCGSFISCFHCVAGREVWDVV